MSFDDLEERPKIVPNYSGICPTCKGKLMFIHDLRCQTCDNQTVMWCRTCQKHKKLRI